MTTKTSQTYDLQIKRTINDDLLDSIIITAAEGGINYWAEVRPVAPNPKRSDYPRLMLHGTSETEEDFTPMPLDREAALRGLRRVIETEPCRRDIYAHIMQAIDDNDGCHIDAEAADVIVQIALFNELIYS